MKRKKVIFVVLGCVVLFFLYRQYHWEQSIADWVAQIEAMGALGMFIYIFLYIVATVLLIPGSIITLAAGFIYGPWLGTVLVSCASMAGAIGAFFISRSVFGIYVQKLVQKYPAWTTFDQLIASSGKKIVFLLRLSPVFPFNILNYLLGLSSISSKDYIVASWIGMLPGTFLYVYFGSLLENLTQKPTLNNTSGLYQQWYWAMGLVLTCVLVVYLSKLAKNALEKEKSNV
ncbi:MAG: TVP38/TMEM64 family protein [Deltaproteobacteria bacterium]|nr:TVP38/TMEM64 family protein [Deltaproteobacteria bacterium]